MGLFGEVDNREATMSEPRAAVYEETGIVRTPPLETAVHVVKQGLFDGPAIESHFTTDSTHRPDQP
jgi:hypothetical protein